jgi:hypothetical protein
MGEFLEFAWLPTFERSAAGLLDEQARDELEAVLVENPKVGAPMPRTGGFRKMRWAARGKGKRGGARIIYYYVAKRETVYMVLAYGKDVQDDLTERQRAELRQLARTIKKGGR